MIPPKLHRIVLRPLQSTGAVERYWQEFRSLHPDWELITWSDPLPEDEFEFGPLFNRCTTPAGVADLLRLEVLWRYGGVYVDTDCEPVRSLKPLLENDCFVGTEDGRVLSTGVIGSTPGHPALRAYMDAIVEEDRLGLDVPPNQATGPVLATHVLGGRDDVRVLPPEFFYPAPWQQPGPARHEPSLDEVVTPFTYVVHRWAHSWATPQERSAPGRGKELLARWRQTARQAAVSAKSTWSQLPPRPDGTTHATYVGEGRVLARLPDGSVLTVLASDLSLTPELVAHGIYDRPFWDFLRRVVQPGDHVVDVGANVGLFTVLMARLVRDFGRVYAYEPDPELADLVWQNAEANHVSQSVQVVRRAAAAGDGNLSFSRDRRYRGSSSARDARAGRVEGAEVLTVAGERIDSRVPHDVPLRLVKIDVEGGEAAALRGLDGLLRAGAVRLIDVEVVRANAGSQWPELVSAMRDLVEVHGATTHGITDDGGTYPLKLDDVVSLAGSFPHVVFCLDGSL